MRDGVASAAAVFEPEEAQVLATAFRIAMARLAKARTGEIEGDGAAVAKLVHDLGRSRIGLRKQLHTDKHAMEIAEQAIEQLAFLDEAPAALAQAAREVRFSALAGERIVAAFPKAYRQPPVNRLHDAHGASRAP